MSWPREQCEVLIDEYQKHPCLYIVKMPLYKNKHARESALNAIQGAVRHLKPTVSINKKRSLMASSQIF
ncbi:hypothetical protein RN001_002495 [Aquatica leii]|uniref:MADF domain-containing protein n=1 Tax=Aquatica leii TaxID=1421715 RepID=A0AAN7PH02_9COLE|nr:hypothetical protein RN001_002495 [Aquatica leii]